MTRRIVLITLPIGLDCETTDNQETLIKKAEDLIKNMADGGSDLAEWIVNVDVEKVEILE